MAKRRVRKTLKRRPILSPFLYIKRKGKETIAKMPPGKKPREYDLIRLDDLGGLLFPLPIIRALAILAEEIRDKALAEIAGKRDLKEELLNLRILYESYMLTKEEYEKRVKEVTAQLEVVKEYKEDKERA